jgi:hypothetical protein
MVLYAAPSPSGRNDMKLYLNSRGELLDKNGVFWGKSQIARMARDEMPDGLSPASTAKPSGREHEANERLKKLRVGVEMLLEKLDLSDHVCRAFYDLLKQMEPRSLHDVGPNAKDAAKHRRARDEEPSHEEFAKYLRSKGLDEEAIAEALEFAGYGETADALPVAGPFHRLLARQTREPDGKMFEFPKENLAPRYEPPESERRLSARDRRLARDSVPGSEADRHFREMFPNCNVEVGEWPRRRW